MTITTKLGYGNDWIGNSNTATEITQLQNAIGTPITIVHAYIQWDDWNTLLTQGQWAASNFASKTYTPCVALPMTTTADASADAAFKAIVAGTYDSIFNTLFGAFAANSPNQTFYVRPGWEFNGTWFPWSVTTANMADYVAAFQHIANLAHNYSGATIKVIWCISGGSPYNSGFYPGNAAVDLIGFDQFGFGASGTANSQVFENDGVNASFIQMAELAVSLNKPFCINEFADTASDMPAFATNIQNALTSVNGLIVDHFTMLNDINDPAVPQWITNPTAANATMTLFNAVSQQTKNNQNQGGSMSITTSGTNILLNGAPFQFRGINEYFDVATDNGLNQWGTGAVLGLFPGLNWIRINMFGYPSPSALAPIVQQLTAAGVVCELEDHNYPTCLTGNSLTNSANWYASLARQFNSNPLVVYGTQNEPDLSSGWGAVDTEISTIYNALRGAGYQGLILLCAAGGYTTSGLTPSVYAGMTNVAWDLHYYNWYANYATDVPTNASKLQQMVANARATVNLPVFIGEFGIAAGSPVDPGGTEVVTAVQQSGFSCAEWAYTSGDSSFPLLLADGDGNPAGGLSAAGQAAASFIKSAAKVTGGGGGSFTPSPDGTVITLPSQPAIVDSSNNKWTLVNASNTALGMQIVCNGTIDSITRNVLLLGILNNQMVQENSSNNWYSATAPGGWTQIAGNPGLTIPTSNTSNTSNTTTNTVTYITPGVGSFSDGTSTYTILVANDQFAVNGAGISDGTNTSNATYYNAQVYAQDATSKIWYIYTGGTNFVQAPTNPPPPGNTTPVIPPAPPAPPVPVNTYCAPGKGSFAIGTNTYTITAAGVAQINNVAITGGTNTAALWNNNGTLYRQDTSGNWSVWVGFQSTTAQQPTGTVLVSVWDSMNALSTLAITTELYSGGANVVGSTSGAQPTVSGNITQVALPGTSVNPGVLITDTNTGNTVIEVQCNNGTVSMTGITANQAITFSGNLATVKTKTATLKYNAY